VRAHQGQQAEPRIFCASPPPVLSWRSRIGRCRRRDGRGGLVAASSPSPSSSSSSSSPDDGSKTPPPPPQAPAARASTGGGDVTREIISIAAPMLAALACDPVASLVDTAMLGRLGAAPLAAAGVGLSIFNTCAKITNMPLLAATTSSVAAARGQRERWEQEQQQEQQGQTNNDNGGGSGGSDGSNDADPRSAAATSAVAVALAVGAAQAVALAFAGGGAAALAAWGVPAGSPLRADGLAFLSARALGAPATAALLVLQGVFRGLGDAGPTFRAAAAATALNVCLAYALIFGAGMGAKGAALATGVSQLLPALWLASALKARHGVALTAAWDASTLGALAALVGPAGWLSLRTVSVTGAYAAATALATRAGGAAGGAASEAAAAAAAHQVAFGLWLAASLLSDALAVAAQTILARRAAAGDRRTARQVVRRAVAMSAALGLALGAGIAVASAPLARLFTSDPLVLSLLQGTLMPIVAATQPLNALAFALDGVLYGAGGFRFAAVQMALCAAPAVALMGAGATRAGATAAERLGWVWAGLALLMAGRAVSIAAALALRLGPFSGPLLADEEEEEGEEDGGGGGGGEEKARRAAG